MKWAHIPLRQGTDRVIQQILNESFSAIPEHLPSSKIRSYKKDVAEQLKAAVVQAQKRNGLDIYLPVKGLDEREFGLGASIFVTEALLPGKKRKDAGPYRPVDIAAQLLARGNSKSIDTTVGEIDGSVAVRRDSVVGPDPDSAIDTASRRIEYIAAVPNASRRWLILAFSTIGAGNPRDDLADIFVEWFDAVMETFRWQYS
ncbi:hypothetical protein AAH978_17460 [Streptomyces sp. ZYX-F-203]